jgi:hypothetical protein
MGPGRAGAEAHRTTGGGAGTNEEWLRTALEPTVRDMNVRNVSTVLWFLAGWSGAGLIVGFLALPTAWALLGGLMAAAVVRWDPSGRIWGVQPTRRVRPIEEVAAELDARGGAAGSPAGERFRV